MRILHIYIDEHFFFIIFFSFPFIEFLYPWINTYRNHNNTSMTEKERKRNVNRIENHMTTYNIRCVIFHVMIIASTITLSLCWTHTIWPVKRLCQHSIHACILHDVQYKHFASHQKVVRFLECEQWFGKLICYYYISICYAEFHGRWNQLHTRCLVSFHKHRHMPPTSMWPECRCSSDAVTCNC